MFVANFFVANFFDFTLPHAMVAAPIRTRFDQSGKQMVRTALETRGPLETDAEVVADTRRIDLWFMPDPTREPEDVRAVVEDTHDERTLAAWVRLASTSGADEVAAAIRTSRAS